MPSWLTGTLDSVDVTVTTGSEKTYESLNIEPMPFMLDERIEVLEGATLHHSKNGGLLCN
jgi:hypothetical protein